MAIEGLLEKDSKLGLCFSTKYAKDMISSALLQARFCHSIYAAMFIWHYRRSELFTVVAT